MFVLHPSRTLQRLFEHKPYQGAPPSDADFLFVGLDANYDADIESQSIFPLVCEYHDDGVAFWRKQGVHHPFLLPSYSGKGRAYHSYFAKAGFTEHHASMVSFVELLAVPTVSSDLRVEDLSPQHIDGLDRLIRGGPARHVFVSGRVKELLRKAGLRWLPSQPVRRVGPLGVLFEAGEKTVYLHHHFSAMFHQTKKLEQIAAIRTMAEARQSR